MTEKTQVFMTVGERGENKGKGCLYVCMHSLYERN